MKESPDKTSAAWIISTIAAAALAAGAIGVWLFWWPGPVETLRLPEATTMVEDRPSTGAPRGKLVTFLPPETATNTATQTAPQETTLDWPAFRGPALDGISRENVTLAKTWPKDGPKALWSLSLGQGYAGAAVRNGKVYVLDYDEKALADTLRAFRLSDGRELWRYSYSVKVKPNHGMSRTVPAVSDRYVVTIGPKCHVLCVDAVTGEFRWSMDLVSQYGTTVPLWYASQCPIIDGDNVILAPAGPGALMIAIDLATGKPAWKSPAPNPQNWKMTHSSIVPMEFEGRRMYVYCGSGGVAGVSAADGTLLWQTNAWRINTATVPTPVVLPGGRIFCSGGYNAGAAMLQLRLQGQRIVADVLYRLEPKVFGATQQTPVYFKGHIYGIRPDGRLVCLDEAGKVLWTSGDDTFGLGPLLIAGEMIFAMDDDGLLRTCQATPAAYRPLSQAKVLPGPESWGPMAPASGRLIVRDLTHMVCLDVSGQ